MKFTKIPADTFQQIQLNAGILVDDFNPADMSIGKILGATTGGINFTATPTFSDYGEDIDNCPKNTKELKKITGWTITASGTLVTTKAATTKKMLAAADVSGNKITPRMDLAAADFGDIWVVGDYSDKNGPTNGGFIACHIINALSTGGFSLVTSDGEKGQFAFEFTGHTSISAQETVPFEMYVQAGTAET